MRAYATAVGRPVEGGYQFVTTSGTSARTTNAVGDQIYKVMLECSEACHIAFGGAGVVATTSDPRIPADTLILFPIRPGERVAAIQISGGSGGTLHVSELDD